LPIYTYQCRSCENVLEKRQSFSDAPLSTCEACGGDLRKLLHPVGIVFKGSGFYNTDYRGSNGADKKTEPTKSEAGDGAAASTDKAAQATEPAGPAKSDGGAATKTEAGTTGAKAETSTAGSKTD
jgi:putative FmdB family regulatory protein